MAKVMLVIDDYTELIFVENLLKRMGFDVLSLNRDTMFGEALLGFFPDVLISSFKGKSVDGLKLRETLKKKSVNSKVIALPNSAQAAAMAQDVKTRFDGVIETPVQPTELLKLLAQLLKMDGNSLLEKFDKLNKARSFTREGEVRSFKDEASPDPIVATVSSKTRPDGTPLTVREQRYEAFLAKLDDIPVDKVIPHAEMSKAVKALEKDSPMDPDLEKRLLEQKQEFVRALIKSKKPQK